MRTPSATVVAAALVIAVASGGVGYTAGKLPKNSVASKQIKNGSVKTVDLKDRSVTGAKVQDNSLTGADINEGSLVLPAPSGVGTVKLTGYDFQPRTGTSTFSTTGGGEITSTADGSSFVASVDLPDNATVSGVRIFVVDNSLGNDVITEVVRYDAVGRSATLSSPTPTTTTGASTALQTLQPPAISPTPTSKLSLVVTMDADVAMGLWGAEVDYSY